MKKNKQPDGMPVWFNGKSINEALFCDEFLQTHKIIFTNGAFFTPEGRVTDELPLRGEIFEELKCCAVSNIPRKISNIVELMKLAALVEDFPPEPDRIHLSNGTLFLDGTFVEGKSEIVRNCFPVVYNPNAPKPVLWLKSIKFRLPIIEEDMNISLDNEQQVEMDHPSFFYFGTRTGGRHRRVLRALTYTVEALWRNAERSGVISPNMPSRIREELNPMIKR